MINNVECWVLRSNSSSTVVLPKSAASVNGFLFSSLLNQWLFCRSSVCWRFPPPLLSIPSIFVRIVHSLSPLAAFPVVFFLPFRSFRAHFFLSHWSWWAKMIGTQLAVCQLPRCWQVVARCTRSWEGLESVCVYSCSCTYQRERDLVAFWNTGVFVTKGAWESRVKSSDGAVGGSRVTSDFPHQSSSSLDKATRMLFYLCSLSRRSFVTPGLRVCLAEPIWVKAGWTSDDISFFNWTLSYKSKNGCVMTGKIKGEMQIIPALLEVFLRCCYLDGSKPVESSQHIPACGAPVSPEQMLQLYCCPLLSFLVFCTLSSGNIPGYSTPAASPLHPPPVLIVHPFLESVRPQRDHSTLGDYRHKGGLGGPSRGHWTCADAGEREGRKVPHLERFYAGFLHPHLQRWWKLCQCGLRQYSVSAQAAAVIKGLPPHLCRSIPLLYSILNYFETYNLVVLLSSCQTELLLFMFCFMWV